MTEDIKGMAIKKSYQIWSIIVIFYLSMSRPTSCRRNFGRDIGAWEKDRKRVRKLADEMLPIVTFFVCNIITFIIIQKHF